MTPGEIIQYVTPDMAFISNPSQVKKGYFHKYGRKLKNGDQFVMVWVKFEDRDHYTSIAISKKQIIN